MGLEAIVPHQVSGMKRGHRIQRVRLGSPINRHRQGYSPLSGDLEGPRLGYSHDGYSPREDQDVWVDLVDLVLQAWPTSRQFLPVGLPIVGRSACDRVRDVQIVSADVGHLQELVEDLPASPYEGDSFLVLLATRRLTDEDNPSFEVALSEHDVRTAVREWAPVAARPLAPK